MEHTAYVAVADPARREDIVRKLRRDGLSVIEQPTGFHVVQAIADVIEGHAQAAPRLLVVDAFARGCSGVTIKSGLQELGVATETIVVT